MHRRITSLVLVGTLGLTACSSGSGAEEPSPPPTEGGGVSEADEPGPDPTEETGDDQVTTAPSDSGPADLPVSDAFGPALWSAEVTTEPILTSDRVVYVDGEIVRALDSTGEEIWSVSWPDPDLATMQGTYPHLRLISPDTVALLDGGRTEGEGLSTAAFSINVTLIDVEDGQTQTVNLPVQGASDSGMPRPDSLGAAFALPEDDSMGADLIPTAVLASGEVEEGPIPEDEPVRGALGIGDRVLSTWGLLPDGFSGDGWDSISTTPSANHSRAAVLGSDADSLILGVWETTSVSDYDVRYQVLDVSDGSVVAEPECGVPLMMMASRPVLEVMATSPNREWRAIGSLRLDPDLTPECFGGGEAERTVTLTAITDEGRAFGVAEEPGHASTPVQVSIAPDGTVTTHEIPAYGPSSPLGFLEGDLAVHWQSDTLTVNPLAD